jgi:hypothetical protein
MLCYICSCAQLIEGVNNMFRSEFEAAVRPFQNTVNCERTFGRYLGHKLPACPRRTIRPRAAAHMAIPLACRLPRRLCVAPRDHTLPTLTPAHRRLPCYNANTHAVTRQFRPCRPRTTGTSATQKIQNTIVSTAVQSVYVV